MVNSASGNEKLSISIFFLKNYKEIKLSILVMKNQLATCWFIIINIYGIGMKAFKFLLFICYMIDVFSFSFIYYFFVLLKGRCWSRGKMIRWFTKLINLPTNFHLDCLGFYWEVDINWVFVFMKSCVKVNFKERSNNNNNLWKQDE